MEASIPGRLVLHPSKVASAIIKYFGSSGCATLAPSEPLCAEIIPNNILNYSADRDGGCVPRDGKARGKARMLLNSLEIRRAESLESCNSQARLLNRLRMRMKATAWIRPGRPPDGEEPRKDRAKISESHQRNEAGVWCRPTAGLMELCSSSWRPPARKTQDFAPNQTLNRTLGVRRGRRRLRAIAAGRRSLLFPFLGAQTPAKSI